MIRKDDVLWGLRKGQNKIEIIQEEFSLQSNKGDNDEWLITFETQDYEGILSTTFPIIAFSHSSEAFIDHVLKEIRNKEVVLLRESITIDKHEEDYFYCYFQLLFYLYLQVDLFEQLLYNIEFISFLFII